MTLPASSPITKRSMGIFLHISSLPGDALIGNIGGSARAFIDFLKTAEMSYWQICPLNPVDFFNSPYNSSSAFAGNPLLLDFEDLVHDNLLSQSDLILDKQNIKTCRVDFNAVRERCASLIEIAFQNFNAGHPLYHEYVKFITKHEFWLEPFALFEALQTYTHINRWYQWDKVLHSYHSAKKSSIAKKIQHLVHIEKFEQFLFFYQWQKLQQYAQGAGIKIIGDIPIYISYNSADLWANKHLFFLDPESELPTHVSGVPPDFFSATGQIWGNPLYNWEALKESHYDWWIKRLHWNSNLYDLTRIDHFRAFSGYWSVPITAKLGKEGFWEKGPGIEFFEKLFKICPKTAFVAEDLGVITSDVVELMQKTELPGMDVAHYAKYDNLNDRFLPHSMRENAIGYLGTHDNDTTLGWFSSLSRRQQAHALVYFDSSPQDISWNAIESLAKAPPNLVIINAADVIAKDSGYRFNRPGTIDNLNWTKRFTQDDFHSLLKRAPDLAKLAKSTHRS